MSQPTTPHHHPPLPSLVCPPESRTEKEVEKDERNTGDKVDKDHPEPAKENHTENFYRYLHN